MYSDSQRYYCFGCGAGGDVLDFVGRMEGLMLPEAIRRLEGYGSVATAPASIRPKAASPAPVISRRDLALMTTTARFYSGQLRRSRLAQDYLASRGIGPGPARRLGLGYAPGSGLRQCLRSAGFDAVRQRASGLFREGGAERFAGMITVPDAANGLVRWLTGRALDPTARPRFQALPGCPRVFLAFDNDDTGNSAAEALGQLLGNRAAVVNLPDGIADVGELATRPNGQPLFRRLLQRAARDAR